MSHNPDEQINEESFDKADQIRLDIVRALREAPTPEATSAVRDWTLNGLVLGEALEMKSVRFPRLHRALGGLVIGNHKYTSR